MTIDPAELDRRFGIHSPTEEQETTLGALHTAVRDLGDHLAGLPSGDEKGRALVALEDVLHWGREAIIRPPRPEPVKEEAPKMTAGTHLAVSERGRKLHPDTVVFGFGRRENW